MTSSSGMEAHNPLTSGDFTEVSEPFRLFAEWLAEAEKTEPNDPNAMTLSTVDEPSLVPAGRVG